MTFNIGDRVRVRNNNDGTTTLGETGTVIRVDEYYLWIDWDPVDHPVIDGGWSLSRFEKIEDPAPVQENPADQVTVDGTTYAVGDVLEVAPRQTIPDAALDRVDRVRLSHILPSTLDRDRLGYFEPFEGGQPLEGGWFLARFRHAAPREGDLVRWADGRTSVGVGEVVAGEADMVRVRWNSDLTTTHFGWSLRVVGRATPDNQPSGDVAPGVVEEAPENETKEEKSETEGPSTPRTAAEWEALWGRLSDTANRLADEYDMCSQFEQNVEDLGLPGRSEREGDIEITFRRMTEVQVTVYVPQYARYTLTTAVDSDGDPVGDLSDLIAHVDEGDLYWEEIDSYEVAEAVSSVSARNVNWEETGETDDFEYEDHSPA